MRLAPGASTLLLFLALPLAAAAQRTLVEPRDVPTTRPAAPRNVVATVTAPGEVTVTWEPVAGATAYDVGRLVRPDGWRRVTRVDGGVLRYVDTGRDLSRAHMYQVVAVVGALASLPGRSAELPGEAATGPAAAASEPALAAASCTGNYAGGRFICRSAERQLDADFHGRMPLVVECPAGTFVVAGGWAGTVARATAVVSQPRHVSAWEVVIEVPLPAAGEARQAGSVQAVATCKPD